MAFGRHAKVCIRPVVMKRDFEDLRIAIVTDRKEIGGRNVNVLHDGVGFQPGFDRLCPATETFLGPGLGECLGGLDGVERT